MAEYIERMKEEFRGLLPDAVTALRHTLQVQKDGRIALEILRDVGVAPRKGEEPQLPATTAEDGYSRQAVMIANVLLEGREHMGLDLGPEIEGALANDEQESHPPMVQRISSHCATGRVARSDRRGEEGTENEGSRASCQGVQLLEHVPGLRAPPTYV